MSYANLHKYRNKAALEVVDIIILACEVRLLDECIHMFTWLCESPFWLNVYHGKHKEIEVSLFCQICNITWLDDEREMSN